MQAFLIHVDEYCLVRLTLMVNERRAGLVQPTGLSDRWSRYILFI